MSDTADTETMKVSGAAETSPSPKDNTVAKPEVTEQSSKDEHGSNNKRDAQVTNSDAELAQRLVYTHHCMERALSFFFPTQKPLVGLILLICLKVPKAERQGRLLCT